MADYSDSGIDAFLTRSVDNTPQINLESQGPSSRSVAYDRTQVTGVLGDTYRIGNILLDGRKGRITILDDTGNTVVMIGELDG